MISWITYDFTDHCLSVVASDDFDTHLAWSGVCHGAGAGYGGEEEEGGGLHDEMI